MKYTLTLIAMLLFIIHLSAQEADYEAPVNPDYLKYYQKVLAGQFPSYSDEGFALNEIPLYVLPDFKNFLQARGNKNILFDPIYDLRTQGLLTPVKSQGSCGCCWTFASMSSIESSWLKTGYGTFDLSEQNVRTCHGFTLDSIDGTCTGGNPKKTAAYLSRRDGPVLESQSPYNTSSTETCDSSFTPVSYVGELRLVPGTPDVLKQAILDYGALYTNMMYSSTYLNQTNNTYYYSGTDATNHAVTMAGWDDTKVTAGGTGAWIIKNSYGTSWGQNGYFYVSYNDSKILSTNAFFPNRYDYNSDEKIYMYDELGAISSIGYTSSETGYGLIKFVPTSNEKIIRIGTATPSAGTVVDIELYDTKTGNTMSGLLDSLTNQVCDLPGFHIFTLAQPINITAGNDFYIKVKYYTPGYFYPIPIERFSADYANPQIEADVCWGSSSGTSWTAYGNNVAGKERDLCIQAYTLPQNVSDGTVAANIASCSIYPNPSGQTEIIVKIQNIEWAKALLLNTTGQVVFQKINKGANSDFVIDTHTLSKGVYFLQLTGKTQTHVEKIVIE